MVHRFTLIRTLLLLTMGVYTGVLFTVSINWEVYFEEGCIRQSPLQEIMNLKDHLHSREDLIFLGVMTAPKYLRNRVVNAYNTWVKTIPGRVQFFYTEGVADNFLYHPFNIPIVALPGFDDQLPDAKKGLLLLKYMHDNFGDKYEWFMKISDDSQLNGKQLLNFLKSITKSSKQFFGHIKEKVPDTENSPWKENFCIGSPGVIFNRAFLKAIVPYINYCLQSVPILFEEVAIGKCLQSAIAASCNQTLETIKGNINLSTDRPHFSGDLNNIPKEEISMHTTEIQDFKYWTEKTKIENRLRKHRYKVSSLRRDVRTMDYLLGGNRNDTCHHCVPSLLKSIPKRRQEVLDWDFFKSDVLCSKYSDNPVVELRQRYKNVLKDIEKELDMLLNQRANEKGRILTIESLSYGYIRLNSLYGVDYVLDFEMIFKKTVGKYLEMPVRHHVVVQQQFNDLEIKEIMSMDVIQNKGSQSKKIHFILPLIGKYQTFLTFMSAFENCCLKVESEIALVLIAGTHESMQRLPDIVIYIQKLQSMYPNHDFLIIQTKSKFLTRTQALMIGYASLSQDSLLFLIDMRLTLKLGILETIQLNTIAGQQVYLPIPFNNVYHFFPDKNSPDSRTKLFDFDDSQHFQDTILLTAMSVYKKDLDNAMNGCSSWVDCTIDNITPLFTKNKVVIFQAPDPFLEVKDLGLECESALCRNNTDLRKVGDQKMLAEYVYLHEDLYLNFQ